jgi:hypothetical protein
MGVEPPLVVVQPGAIVFEAAEAVDVPAEFLATTVKV